MEQIGGTIRTNEEDAKINLAMALGRAAVSQPQSLPVVRDTAIILPILPPSPPLHLLTPLVAPAEVLVYFTAGSQPDVSVGQKHGRSKKERATKLESDQDSSTSMVICTIDTDHETNTGEGEDKEEPMDVAGPCGGAVPMASQTPAPLPLRKLMWTLINLSWDMSALDLWFHPQQQILGGNEYWVMNEPIPRTVLDCQWLPRDPNLTDAPKLDEYLAEMKLPVIALERQTYRPLPLLPMTEKFHYRLGSKITSSVTSIYFLTFIQNG